MARVQSDCKLGRQGGCDRFVELFASLLGKYDCAPPWAKPGETGYLIAAIRICEEEKGGNGGGGGSAFAMLAGLDAPKARALFASDMFREALPDELHEAYWKWSIYTERRLVLEGRTGGTPGPILEYSRPGITARSSNTLEPRGESRYDASLAFDGKPFTGWCTGGTGIGEWIEFSLPARQRPRPPFRGFQVIPGYARTQETYIANGRVAKIRISSCAHPEASFDAELKPDKPDDFDAAVVRVDIHDDALLGEGTCARFTILHVTRGSVPDSCISEILPF